MTNIASKHYKASRLKNTLKFSFKKILQMGILVFVGEYMLLGAIRFSLSQQDALSYYRDIPAQIVSFAVSEKPILHVAAKVAEAYDSSTKKIDFDKILQNRYPVSVKGTRPDFRTLDLQDKEGAKIGYVVKF